MTEIIKRLDRHLESLEYSRRLRDGHVLGEPELKLIFSILKEADKEIGPVLESYYNLCKSQLAENYLFVEKEVKSLLKYYNIIDGSTIMNSRHQLFFTEEKKMIKKPYFSKDNLNYIKNVFKEQNLFTKLGLNNE
jgi:hypothetical protein